MRPVKQGVREQPHPLWYQDAPVPMQRRRRAGDLNTHLAGRPALHSQCMVSKVLP